MIIEIPDSDLEKIARAEAQFDGREWMAMPQADRARYVERIRALSGLWCSVLVSAQNSAADTGSARQP